MPDYITLMVLGVHEAVIALEHYSAEVVAEARHELINELAHTVDEIKAAAPVGPSRTITREHKNRGGKTHHVEGGYREWHTGGELRDSFRYKVDPVGISGRILTPAYHAHLVEFGHRGATFEKAVNVEVAPGVFRRVRRSVEVKGHPFFVGRVIAARQRFAETLKRVLEKPIPELGPGTVEVRET